MSMMLMNVNDAPTHGFVMAMAGIIWFGYWIPLMVARWRRLRAILTSGR